MSGTESQEPVVVWEAPNQLEAQIVVGRLQSEDIPAMIRGEAAGTVFGFTTGNLAATEVLVPPSLAQRAIEILETDVVWDEDDLDGDDLDGDETSADERGNSDDDNDVDVDQ